MKQSPSASTQQPRTPARAPQSPAPQAVRCSLDTLRAEHGEGSAAMRQIAFRGYNPERGLQQGQDTATERILDAVSPFTLSTVSVWNALSPAQRTAVLGFNPKLIPVLLDEAAALRDHNARYDAVAKRAQVAKVQREKAARQALQDGRALRDQASRAVRLYLGAEALDSDGFERALGSAVSPETLALGMCEFADYIDGFHADLDAETLAAYAEIGIGTALSARLRESATLVRRTTDDLNALDDQTRVAQRQLDAQDGRVLHIIGLIYSAFRNAARRDPTLLVPDLGELTSMFERQRPSAPAAPPPASDPAAPSPSPA